ncbi:hypothetical protein ACLKA6_001480 [Drosophila palustris]
MPLVENQFITKTCLTTYTYHTTYLHNGSTTVENVEKVVSNRHTEERNYLRASTDLPMGLTLSNTPELVVGIFPTTYHYYNKLRNNDLVLTSSYTIINTVTGPEDYIAFLQPSEAATPLQETNTYYSRLPLTSSISDGVQSTSILTDERILTQVVITESIPARGSAGPDRVGDRDVHIYATKTILTTISYVATPAISRKQLHTRVIESVITDVVPSSVLRSELVSRFRQELHNRKVLVTMATLLSGQTLEVTAVSGPKATTSGLNASSETASVAIIHATKPSITLESSSMQSDVTDFEAETEAETESEEAAESEIKNVYVKPLKNTATQSTAANVEQLIGSLNLQRFRPVFNVMADLLQKNLVSRQSKPQTQHISTPSQDTLEGPNYIPLQIVEQGPNTYRLENKSTENATELDINLGKLSAHSLHINPPELDVIDDNWQQQHNVYRDYIQSLRPPTLPAGYQHSLLNNGIPIRPGEIINANADVIIGKPNGINLAHFSRPDYRSNLSTPIATPTPKQKFWMPSMIPLSLIPPQVTEVTAYDRDYATITMLRPPSKVAPSYSKYMSSAVASVAPITPLRSPMAYNKLSHIYGSEQQIANLNSELNNNEILEIRQIPQIFSTKLPAITRYPTFESTQYTPSVPGISAAPHQQHHINFKLDVLSHNVNMNAPPLTFKRDNENFPVASATAIQGHIAVPPMPLVKIPLNQAHVEVRLSPQSTQLAVEPPQPAENAATFKQRNQNLSKTFDGTPVVHGITSASPSNNYYSKLRKPNRNLFYFNTTSKNVAEDSNPMATNKQLVYLKIKHDDQAADYTTYNLKKNPQFSSRNTSSTQLFKSKQSTTPKPDLQSYKTIGLGQPFVKPKPDPMLTRGSAAISVSNIPKKLYLATGEGFNLRSQLMSEFIRPLTAATSDEVFIDSYATVLSPPPLPTHLKPSVKHTLTYETKLNALGLQPPPAPIDRHSSSILATTPLSSTVIANLISHSKDTKTVVRTSLNSEKKHFSTSSKIRKSSTVNRSMSHQYSAINIKPMIMPIHETTLKTNIMFSHNKLSTESESELKSNTPTRKIIRPAMTSKVELSLLSTQPWKDTTFSVNGYTRVAVNHSSIYNTVSQSPSLSLESSEVVLPTGINLNFAIDPIKSSSAVTNQLSDIPKDISTTTTAQQILFGTTAKKELASTTSNISVLYTQTSIVISRSKVKSKSKTSTRIQPSAPTRVKKPSNVTSKESNLKKTTKHSFVASTTLITSKTIRPDVSSILVVMSKVSGNEKEPQHNSVLDIDYDANVSFELPTRDEELEPRPNSNSVLLGGVVLATDAPYRTQSSSPQLTDACHPSCKSSKNEICVQTSGYGGRCECRLGFARIFPDRPCKPTYTYEMSIPASRIGSYLLKFDQAFLNNSSSQYRHLSSVILDAIDRMVMQSDFRDEYYGVQLKEFTSASDGAVIGKFLLQLSENSDENRLETVFKKYLRRSNYSIGGTELYTSKEHINSLTIQDFNECGNGTFNDCSIHAQCFNLVGSYTCICPDGYADISENPIYPGRHCSDKLIGCDKCNYHGNCVQQATSSPNGTAVCECFAWYTGATCQLNLKILFICLIVSVTVFVVLLVCMLFIYARRKVHGDSLTRPIFITATNYHHPSLLTASSKISPGAFYHERSIDKHAILNDSNSDSSHISEPYIFKKPMDVASTAKAPTSKRSNSGKAVNNKFRDHYENKGLNEPEQSDRSLTVMIPRARYFHPTVLPQAQLDETKTTKRPASQQNSAYNDNNLITSTTTGDSSSELPQKSGALVSAGFEVSAIVSDRSAEPNELNERNEHAPKEQQQRQQQVSRTNMEAILRSGEEIQRMSSWMSNIHTNAISADVRSFDETTVQAVTKSMHLCFDMQTQSTTNEEPNTMTERDLGSTFLLPHTHLYMPEKLESDLSGFDSI